MTSASLKFVLLGLVVGCSSTPPRPYHIEHSAKPGVFVKSRPVADRKQARHYIQNQLDFLVLTFEQSRDPYYGKLKWSDDCLKANRIGTMTENDSILVAKSNLYVNEFGELGQCPGNPKASPYLVAFYHCESSGEVIEIKVPESAVAKFGTDFCDD